jgi:hypothetical protein
MYRLISLSALLLVRVWSDFLRQAHPLARLGVCAAGRASMTLVEFTMVLFSRAMSVECTQSTDRRVLLSQLLNDLNLQ